MPNRTLTLLLHPWQRDSPGNQCLCFLVSGLLDLPLIWPTDSVPLWPEGLGQNWPVDTQQFSHFSIPLADSKHSTWKLSSTWCMYSKHCIETTSTTSYLNYFSVNKKQHLTFVCWAELLDVPDMCVSTGRLTLYLNKNKKMRLFTHKSM